MSSLFRSPGPAAALTSLAAGLALIIGLSLASAPARADGGPINWTGQGTSVVNGQRVLNTVRCDANFTPYILWVFTATGADSATITINGSTFNMVKQGNGAFHYTSGWYNLNTVTASASWVGTSSSANPQLVISHGCPPRQLLWCSPGFWAQNQARLAGSPYDPAPYLNDALPGYNFTVGYALANPSIVKGPAFNAAANYLASKFGWGGTQATSENCPIDAFGRLK